MIKICIVLLVLVVTASGQTSADLSAKYSQITAYQVRSDVQMTARFSGDGQVCEMTLEKKAKTDSGIVLGASSSEKEVRSLVDDLVPEGLRGRDLRLSGHGALAIFLLASLRRGGSRRFNQEQTQFETVPKIVPSGGLFLFRSRLARMQQSRMNTGESNSVQIPLNC